MTDKQIDTAGNVLFGAYIVAVIALAGIITAKYAYGQEPPLWLLVACVVVLMLLMMAPRILRDAMTENHKRGKSKK